MYKDMYFNSSINNKLANIVCKNYKICNLTSNRSDNNRIVRLYTGDLIPPIDFVFKRDKNDNIVSCFNYSSHKIRDEYHTHLKWNERFLVFVNQQAYYNASRYVNRMTRGIRMDKDELVRDFSEVMVYQWMKFFKDVNYTIPEYDEYSLTYKMAEATIISAMINPYRFLKDLKKRYPNYVVGKKAVYSCYDDSISSLDKIRRCKERRMRDKMTVLITILCRLNINTVDRYVRMLKNGKIVWNYKALTVEYNNRVDRIGLDKVKERTIRNYLNEIEEDYHLNPDIILDMAKKAYEKKKDKRNRNILSKVDTRGVSLGYIFVDYHGTKIHVMFNDHKMPDSYSYDDVIATIMNMEDMFPS